MGRAGGGGGRVGGGRSGGGSFSRSGGGRSFSSHSSRPGGSFSGHHSFGGPVHHGPMHHHRPHYHHYHHHHHGGFLFGPWFWGPRYGYGRTIIINNGGNPSGNTAGSYTSQNAQGMQETTYTEPKPMTIDQKIAQAEKLHNEAAEGKKKALIMLAVATVVLAFGIWISFLAKQNSFVKAELAGTVEAGYAYDDGFTYDGGKTEAACRYFYEKTGVPLFFYTIGEYEKEASTCDDYTMQLYDKLFSDENHVLVAYYDNVDWWSWAIGANAVTYMDKNEVNDLIDTIYVSWEDYSLSNDAVLAKGIKAYANEMTHGDQDARVFAVILYVVAGVIAIVAVISFVNNKKDEKYYEEETEKLRMDKMRGE